MARRAIILAFSMGLALPVSLLAQAPRTFDSPQAAVDALIASASTNDTAGLASLFGSNGKEILTSGDPQKDKAEREEFVKLANGKRSLEPSSMNRNVMILIVGDEQWPFPVPIVRTNGKWSFDTAQGAIEMRARRIGANELDAIEICAGYVAAQDAYAGQDRDQDGMLEYAMRIMSSPGKHDGLYWEGSDALVPKGFAEAESRTGAAPKAYHGYYFRILQAQGPDAPGGPHNYVVKDSMIGGFGLAAWPAQYGVTGVHTFIVNQDGTVYEKDLGPPPAKGPVAVSVYNPDKTWTPVN